MGKRVFTRKLKDGTVLTGVRVGRYEARDASGQLLYMALEPRDHHWIGTDYTRPCPVEKTPWTRHSGRTLGAVISSFDRVIRDEQAREYGEFAFEPVKVSGECKWSAWVGNRTDFAEQAPEVWEGLCRLIPADAKTRVDVEEMWDAHGAPQHSLQISMTSIKESRSVEVKIKPVIGRGYHYDAEFSVTEYWDEAEEAASTLLGDEASEEEIEKVRFDLEMDEDFGDVVLHGGLLFNTIDELLRSVDNLEASVIETSADQWETIEARYGRGGGRPQGDEGR